MKEEGDAVIYNVRWNESETKKIYKASSKSEQLMEYLETKLYELSLIQTIGEHPSPTRGYGVLVYYYKQAPYRQLLTAAPRKLHDYIHVVLTCGIFNKDDLQSAGFKLGNNKDPRPDLKVQSKEQIHTLANIIQRNNYKLQ
jgi:hypothetical protein